MLAYLCLDIDDCGVVTTTKNLFNFLFNHFPTTNGAFIKWNHFFLLFFQSIHRFGSGDILLLEQPNHYLNCIPRQSVLDPFFACDSILNSLDGYCSWKMASFSSSTISSRGMIRLVSSLLKRSCLTFLPSGSTRCFPSTMNR